MKRLPILAAALAMTVLLAAPAWAILDFSASAEYVTAGTVEVENPLGTDEADLDGGILLGARLSVLGFTAGAEIYSDSSDEADWDLDSWKLKAGYGIGLPGIDLTALATYYNWTLSVDGDELEAADVLLGVNAVVTLVPKLTLEGWYDVSVLSDVAADSGVPLTGDEGDSASYGIRVIYDVGMGFGVSAGYRVEEHTLPIEDVNIGINTSGITLGVSYIF